MSGKNYENGSPGANGRAGCHSGCRKEHGIISPTLQRGDLSADWPEIPACIHRPFFGRCAVTRPAAMIR